MVDDFWVALLMIYFLRSDFVKTCVGLPIGPRSRGSRKNGPPHRSRLPESPEDGAVELRKVRADELCVPVGVLV